MALNRAFIASNAEVLYNPARQIAIDPFGRMWLVYRPHSTYASIYVRHSDDYGVSWSGATVVMDEVGECYPSIAIDSIGNVHVYGDSDHYVKYDYATATWGSPEATGIISGAYGGAIAVDSSDNPHIAALNHRTSVGAVYYASRTRVETVDQWQALTAYNVGDFVIPTGANTYNHAYKCTTGGTTAAGEPTWPTVSGNTVSDGSVVWIAIANAWTEKYQVSSGSDMQYPSLAIDDDDSLHIAWYDYGDQDIYYRKYNALTPAWEAQVRVTTRNIPANESNKRPCVAVDSSGNAYIAFRKTEGIPDYIGYVSSSDSWTAVTEIEVFTGEGDVQLSNISLAFDVNDVPFICWQEYDDEKSISFIMIAKYNSGLGYWQKGAVLVETDDSIDTWDYLYIGSLLNARHPATSLALIDGIVALVFGHQDTDGNNDVYTVVGDILFPVVRTDDADDITINTATLNATLYGDGWDTTCTCYFEYGDDTSYGYVTAEQSIAQAANGTAFEAAITRDVLKKTVHFRAVATNSHGTAYGADNSFEFVGIQPTERMGRVGSLVHRYDRDAGLYSLEITFGGIKHTVPSNPFRLGATPQYSSEPPIPVTETFGDKLVYIYQRRGSAETMISTRPLTGSWLTWYMLIWVGYIR